MILALLPEGLQLLPDPETPTEPPEEDRRYLGLLPRHQGLGAAFRAQA